MEWDILYKMFVKIIYLKPLASNSIQKFGKNYQPLRLQFALILVQRNRYWISITLLTLLQFSGFDSTGSNLSLFDEGTFKIGRDFRVHVMDNYNKEINLSLGNGIEELVTFFNGRCYKLTFNFTLTSTEYLRIWVIVNENILTKDIPHIDFSLTTEEEAYGVIIDKYSDIDDLIYTSTRLGPEGFHSTLLQGSVYKRLKSTSNCTPNAHLMRCISQK